MSSPEGEFLAKEYYRYHHTHLWPEIHAFLTNLDILSDFPVHLRRERRDRNDDDDSDSSSDEEDDQLMERHQFYVQCTLPNPGWVELIQQILKALETRVQSVWRIKTALSLHQIINEKLEGALLPSRRQGRLESMTFLLRATLAFAETHGTKAARELLEREGML